MKADFACLYEPTWLQANSSLSIDGNFFQQISTKEFQQKNISSFNTFLSF